MDKLGIIMKNTFLKIFTLSLLGFCFFYLFKNKKSDKNIITMGTMSGWAPYVYIDKNGDYVGFDVEIAKIIAQTPITIIKALTENFDPNIAIAIILRRHFNNYLY